MKQPQTPALKTLGFAAIYSATASAGMIIDHTDLSLVDWAQPLAGWLKNVFEAGSAALKMADQSAGSGLGQLRWLQAEAHGCAESITDWAALRFTVVNEHFDGAAFRRLAIQAIYNAAEATKIIFHQLARTHH